MKIKILLLIAFTTFSVFSFAQTEKYYRVKISAPTVKELQELGALGIDLEEGDFQQGNYFIAEIPESELNNLKASTLHYEVLIDDLSSYYEQRNKLQGNEEPVQVNCPYTTPANFKLGAMGGFLTLDQMLATLDSMRAKYPNLISVKQAVSTTLTSIEGRTIYYVRISNNPDVLQNKPKVLYTGLHHAREPLSMQHLIYYMWYLLENYNTDPTVKNLVDNLEMYFVPCVNPDGYVYNQTTNPNGGGLWRKNRRLNSNGTYGVDLNRNYGYEWGYDNIGSSNQQSSDTYRGTGPFSEPETQIMQNFTEQYHFYLAINNHSYDNVLVIPWNYKANFLTPDKNKFTLYADSLVKCNKFKAGTANKTVGYTANGTSDDWMYGDQTDKPKIFAMTAESGSGSDGFWPKSTNITALCEKNMDMNLQAAKITLAHGGHLDARSELVSAESGIHLYQNAPNPAQSDAVIKYEISNSSSSGYKLTFYNLMGEQVKHLSIDPSQQSVEVNIADLPAGMYYYFIGNSIGKSAVFKMQIIR
jgi:carboxypeptidase T